MTSRERAHESDNDTPWQATDILGLVSTSCALIFLTYLPFRIQELRVARSIHSASGWQALPQLVSTQYNSLDPLILGY